MNTDWHHFLEQHPPKTTDTIPTEPAIMPLCCWQILTVQGDDAASFLQNLCTNDVSALAIDQAQLNSLCNPKGRLLAIFWLLRREDGYQLILPESVSESLLKRLKMYILRSDVQIKPQDEQVVLLGSLHDNTPLPPLQGQQQDDRYLLSLPGAVTRRLQIVDTAQAIKIAQSNPWVEEANWQRIDIDSGIPFIFQATIEQFTPQQINLDLLEGVSFSKGCYPGQEIVARLHYLGSPSRRLFSASAITKCSPEVGSHILLEDKSVVGHIVQAQYTDTKTQLLLSLKLAHRHQTLFLPDSTAALTEVSALAPD